ncbi:sugar ABC transporter ATP-binding protein [Mesorhizobium sp. B292B1B]|uniref:sugar ABC transporter ATP-binding protein n=1 Tax=unclassified Mesorhizobium TaxID=325217 RepID=UPI00112A59CE|nr:MULTISPECIES: sugar ABC transporter ATP-binding protein [unclassified Mesorhizobium]MBZ9965700.1 sugar ABC transporter ATP-binding protein [Mesorhizobium sp. BR1-1-2]MCA0011817.1 sugar ABC transporter ATP-binding protein [Mesorhizobium sp. B294B1A1]MCA0038072.1 sugar ABC transporter ATP-binding protein [Mesorhizobium sp. B292B1B]TPM42625.1 sugar ABC transporter ATP-binding protein [Mesorhizobium sp. B2-3-2]
MTAQRDPASLLLDMHDVQKHFAGIPALVDASLQVLPGEAHALIGQNGAGKSTLIKVLTGYYRRDAGQVLFEQKPFEVGSPHQAQISGISTIYQEINLVPLRSVTENICLGREKRRRGLLNWSAMHAEAERLLGRFSIRIDVRRPLGDFNTATQQMVAIARAIGFSARLVIMDEPTSSLDEREVSVLFTVIRQLKAEGVSVLFVSHKLDELYEVCDRVTIMRDGRTVRNAAMSDIGKLELVAAMLGRDVTAVEGHATAFGERDRSRIGDVLFAAQGLAAGQSVRNVSFDLRRGEIAGFAGLLGAGRTETARLVFGADRRKAGAMTMEGASYHPARAADAIAAGMGFCTEDRKAEGIVPEMTVAENITLALLPKISRNGILNEARQREIVERFIRELGIKCSGPNQKVRELSGGNQQKVLLARWLAMNPKLLILDEPTRGIDVGAKGEIQRLIRKLADDGLGVLMISSELEEVMEGADRIFVLREGASVAELEGQAANEEDVLAAMAHGDAAEEAA